MTKNNKKMTLNLKRKEINKKIKKKMKNYKKIYTYIFLFN